MRAARMRDLVSSGRIVDLVLAVMVLEIGLILWRRSGGRGGLAADLLLAFAPGICLLLALRAALTGGGWIPVAGWIALSLPFHLADLARRLRR